MGELGKHETVQVSQSQASIHVASEAAALVIGVPLLLATASRSQPTEAQRRGLRVMALVTLIVDGWLLSRWHVAAKEAK